MGWVGSPGPARGCSHDIHEPLRTVPFIIRQRSVPILGALRSEQLLRFLGEISYYDYDYPNGPLTSTLVNGSPGWVDVGFRGHHADLSRLARSARELASFASYAATLLSHTEIVSWGPERHSDLGKAETW